jgi:hypothetical protein
MQKTMLTLLCPLVLGGCATVFTGTNQSVHISATDQDNKELNNISCSVIDSTGADYHVSSNPGTVLVPKGKGPLRVSCEQPGYNNYSGSIGSSFNAVTLLDIFFWPTFIVDFGTGAAMKYPGSYHVVMKPVGSDAPASKKRKTLADL